MKIVMSSTVAIDKSFGKFPIFRQCAFCDYKSLVNAYSQFSEKKYGGQGSLKYNKPANYGFNKPLNKSVAKSCCLYIFPFSFALLIFH